MLGDDCKPFVFSTGSEGLETLPEDTRDEARELSTLSVTDGRGNIEIGWFPLGPVLDWLGAGDLESAGLEGPSGTVEG